MYVPTSTTHLAEGRARRTVAIAGLVMCALLVGVVAFSIVEHWNPIYTEAIAILGGSLVPVVAASIWQLTRP